MKVWADRANLQERHESVRGKQTWESVCLNNRGVARQQYLSSIESFTSTMKFFTPERLWPFRSVRWQRMSQKKRSLSLERKVGSRRATCVYIAVSGTGSPPCHALCVLVGSGHPLSGTTQAATDVSQNSLGSLQQNKPLTIFCKNQFWILYLHLDLF